MSNTPPRTVDISAKSVSPSAFGTAVSRPQDYGVAMRQSLAVDAVLLLLSLMVGGLFSIVVSTINAPVDTGNVPLLPSAWLLVVACSAPALLWGFVDVLSTLSNPAALPFSRSDASRQAIYFQRVHTLLLAFYFTAIVVALCWSAITMPLISKLFVSAIFSFALYALGRSIPSQRTSFIVSGVLFLVVLVATQVFIVMRLEADAGMANKRVLDELVAPERDNDDFFQ
ncbi:MAG: hypothetical protein AB8B99_12170 [Phormidesmis sp.]